MTELTYMFATVAVLAGAMTSISVWAPRRLWLKLGAIGAAVLFLSTTYVGALELLSMPKPVTLEWWRTSAEEATVLGSRIEEGEGIYLWLQLKDTAEPRAYSLPWNRSLAEQLQTARREAAHQETDLRMRLPFERSLEDREPKFYAAPQPRGPLKDGERTPPQFYRQGGDA